MSQQTAVPGQAWIGELLERVPFVEWDRFTTGEWRDGQPCVSVYGWIDREDAYKDFVLLLCWPKPETYYFVTSSAEYSEEIYCRLEGVEDTDEHNDCRRVERAFDVENVVRLADSSDEKTLEEVYQDRNLLVCALAEATGAPAGWKPDPDSPDEWAIVWIETPMGQVSWHVPRALVEHENLGLHRRQSDYDGYDRDVKNDRLAAWVKRGCPY